MLLDVDSEVDVQDSLKGDNAEQRRQRVRPRRLSKNLSHASSHVHRLEIRRYKWSSTYAYNI